MFSNKHNSKLDGRHKAQNRKRPAAWRGRIFHPATALALAIVLLGLGAGVAWALNYAGNVTVVATMGQLNPNPIRVGDTATASLSATYEPPGNVPEGTFPTAQYSWSVSVAYKALYAESYGAPPPNSYTLSISPSQPSSSGGAEITFTPLIAGYWQLTGSCGVTVTDQAANEYWTGSANTGPADLTSYLLQIDYGGADVDNQTQNVSVGQQIPLTANFGPADMALNWGVDGTSVIAGYSVNSDSATVTPLTQADLRGPQLSFYWVYTDDGSTENENLSLAGTLPSTAYESVETTFNVFEPAASMGGTILGATSADDNYLVDLQANPPSADDWLHFGGSFNPPRNLSGAYTPGIEFKASWTQPPAQYGDAFTCVQVITENETDWWDTATGQSLTARTDPGEDYLDTAFPYGWEASSPTSASTSDSPGIDLEGYTHGDDEQDSEMYLMFTPSGAKSIPVPVKEVDWSWAGVWPPAAGNAPAPQALTPSQEPQWGANITSVIPVKVEHDRLLGPIPTPRSADGLTARLMPGKSGITVKLVIRNTGAAAAYLSGGATGGWTLRVFEVSKKGAKSAPRTRAGRRMARDGRGGGQPTVVIRPGAERTSTLRLRKYFALRRPGVYIIRGATEWIQVKERRGFIKLGTGLVQLTLSRAGKAKWKTRGVHWPPASPHAVPPPPVVRSVEIPSHGPLKAMAKLVSAIGRGDAQAARSFVFAQPERSRSLAIVNAELAYNRLAAALVHRFGPRAETQLKPMHGTVSPNATATLLRRLDLTTLKICGNSAKVAAWTFTFGASWKWVPGAFVHFRRVHGRWEIADGAARPRNSILGIWEKFMRAQADVYNNLRLEAESGKFRSMKEFEAAYKLGMAAAFDANRAAEIAYLRAFGQKWRVRVAKQQRAYSRAFQNAQKRDDR